MLCVDIDFVLEGCSVLCVGNEYYSFYLDDDWLVVFGLMMMGFWIYVNINDGKCDCYVFFVEWEGKLNECWSMIVGVCDELVKIDVGNV